MISPCAHVCEVPLGLECERGEPDDDAGRQEEGLEHGRRGVERDDHANREGLYHGLE